ncbi:PREDICTED: anti-Muellerian hormone type-2 receptor [Gekko japonicus]|uniref:receptor protein serine/threonine kinase n=1 Tax=Gekko japonicus TaxID=146911 RepID=A0ABM1KVF7_GEKJA|nr:PREDICTED: anti-Muellerian hormone type-2 receptor [Gekko japonicus]
MWIGAQAKNRSCLSYGSGTLREGEEILQGLILEDGQNGTIQCPHNQCCFGVWKVIQGQLQPQLKGCWISEKEATCDSPTCEPRSSEDRLTLSCRCQADLCNGNISHDGKRHEIATLFSRSKYIPLAPTGLSSTCKAIGKTGSQVLHEGQFSKVWQGTFGQHPVAIKTFPHSCYREFASEWAVHSLPLMSHDNVVQLVAAGCGGPDKEQGGLLLVLTLYPLGSLRHFLIQHVCSWDVAIRLGSSLAKGLAFLHGEQWKEGLHKPGVAHRDLSSQNVLVQEDRTCVISDFGLAMTLPMGHEGWRGPPAEGVVRKAGAPRYTAPEILDESLNLQDLGSALKQADVYSMALVLWETLTRCSILFPESGTPDFQLAYDAELGSSPTYSELRRLAAEERGRPAIPPAWRRMGQVSVDLQELLEDCWDPDPEARLQADCAQQRLERLGAADVAKECC